MALGICYDIRFPELALRHAEAGAKLLIYPGACADGDAVAVAATPRLLGGAGAFRSYDPFGRGNISYFVTRWLQDTCGALFESFLMCSETSIF